uniref:Pancreatic trypsin inhibitor n=1 Tax=Rhipicephalus zambeziensis TaxID=60191 RepID=A0A224YBV3_9ACAR
MITNSAFIDCVLICFATSLLAGDMDVFVYSTDPYDPGNCNSLPPNDPCSNEGRTLMWYYKSDIQNCNTYYYSGCGAGVNKFPTYELCMDACGGTQEYYYQEEIETEQK